MDSKAVRIHSDGTGPGSIVIDEDGKKIDNVRAANIWIESGELNRVDLTIVMPVVNVQARVDDVEFICPCCDHVVRHNCSKACSHESVNMAGVCDLCGAQVK